MDNPDLNAKSFRPRNDDGTEVTATWRQDADVTDIQLVDTVYRIRVQIDEDAGFPSNNSGFQIQHRIGGPVGTWVGTTGSTTVVKIVASQLVQAADTTQQLGSGTYVNTNEGQEEVSGVAGRANYVGNDECEFEWSYEIIGADVVGEPFIDFRIDPDDANSTAPSSWYRVTIARFDPDADKFRFYDDDGGEAASTSLAAEDTNIELDGSSNVNLHIRWRVQEVGAGSFGDAAGSSYKLLRSLNGGAFSPVQGGALNVEPHNGSQLSDGSDTTNRTTEGISDGSGSFFAGEQNDSNGQLTNFPHEADNYTEHVWGVTIIAADWSAGDFIEFGIQRVAFTANIASITPKITFVAASGDKLFEGTSAGTSGSTAVFVLDLVFTGISAATSGSTAALALDLQYEATSATVSGSAADLNRDREMASSVAANSSAAAALARDRALDGTAAGTSGSTAALSVFSPNADAFRWYANSGSPSESGSFPLAAESTNFSALLTGDTSIHLRYRVQETGGGIGATTDDYTLEWRLDGSGGWTLITASSSRVRSDTASLLVDGDPTTDRSMPNGISAGTGSFFAGEQEDGDGEITDFQHEADNHTEHVWGLELIKADFSDSVLEFVEFRMLRNGVVMANSVTPLFASLIFTPEHDKFRFYEDGPEDTSTELDDEDANLTAFDVSSDQQIQLRFGVQETGSANGTGTDDFKLLVDLNGGGFVELTDVSNGLRRDSASQLTDQDNTTERLTAGSGSFISGRQCKNNPLEAIDRFLSADNYTEFVYAILCRSADLSDSDVAIFKLQLNGVDIGVLNAQITFAKGADKLLEGTSAGTSGSSADLALDLKLDGTSAGTSGSTAVLGRDRNFAGVSAGTSGSSADLDRDRDLSGTSPGTSGSTAALVLDLALEGTSPGTSGSIADLTVDTGAFIPDADAFRFYLDDGSESGSSAIAAQDADITGDLTVVDIQIHLRYRVQETNGGAGVSGDDYTLEYLLNGGGGWTLITASSLRVQTDTASELTDGDPTTDRGTAGISAGTGSFFAGIQEEGDGEITNFLHQADNYTEHVWAFDIIAADWTEEDFVEFRMLLNGTPIANSVTPRLTAAIFNPDADAFRFYEDGPEATSSPIEDEDVNLTSRNVDSDSQVHLRWRLQEIGGKDGLTTDDYFLQRNLNSGGWVAIDGGSSVVRSDSTSGLFDGSPTTNRSLPDGITDGPISFLAGEQEEANGTIENRQLTAFLYTEHVWAFKLISADLNDGDTIDFRITINGAGDGDAIHSITPRITVQKGIDRLFEGTSASVSGSTAALERDRSFVGSAAGTSGSTANLQVGLVFTGTSAGASGSAADLDLDLAFAGTSAGASGSTADLDRNRGFVGVSAGASDSAADIVLDLVLAGTSPGISDSTSELTIEGQVEFIGVSASVSGSSADLRLDLVLAGVSPGVSDSAAALGRDRELAGVSAGASGSIADLDRDRELAGAAAGASGSTADLDRERGFVAVSAATSGSTAALDLDLALVGVSAGVSGSTAELTVDAPLPVLLEGVSASVSGSTAVLQRDRGYVATAAAISGSAAALARDRSLNATAAATSGSTSNIERDRGFVATVAGTSGSSAAIIVRGNVFFAGVAAGISGSSAEIAIKLPACLDAGIGTKLVLSVDQLTAQSFSASLNTNIVLDADIAICERG